MEPESTPSQSGERHEHYHSATSTQNNTLFQRLKYNKNTRGNESYVLLSKIRISIGRKSLAYQGATIFNQLDKSLRDQTSLFLEI